jgi:Bacteriophage tail sheath protein
MPIAPTYPGVYIEELPSGVRTIAGVATSITAFVGYTGRGLDHRPTRLLSFADYERAFGGLASDSLVGYAVAQYFNNGGRQAWVVRVPKPDGVAASVQLRDGTGGAAAVALELTALSRGGWANDVLVDVDHDVPDGDPKAFNLTLTDIVGGATERHGNVTLDESAANYVEAVVNDAASGSELVSVAATPASGRPAASGTIGGPVDLSALANDQTYRMRVAFDVPAGTTVDVTVIEQGEALPGSLLGLCQLVERKVNLALAPVLPGGRVRCTPAGDAIRLQADFSRELLGGELDAAVTVSAIPASALTMLGLTPAQTTVNVGHYRLGLGRTALGQAGAAAGDDGVTLPGTSDLIGSAAASTGLNALERVDLFNLLCVPDATRPSAGDPHALATNVSPNDVWAAAATLCADRRALLMIDPPPSVADLDAAVDWISSDLTVKGPNAAAYFPRIRAGDPLDDFKPRLFAPSGAVAGLIARLDGARGAWKSPAGTEARLVGVTELEERLTDAEHGVLNPLGLNCLRTFPVYGTVAWGARTLDGADVAASQWKYVAVRRTALYIEESLFRGTKWAVFEPNGEGLWAELRLNIGAFMHGLFRLGAFQGTTPAEAYLVKCDAETTTQADIDRGIVNILVGFAPLKPAEFVFIRLQQLAGQLGV